MSVTAPAPLMVINIVGLTPEHIGAHTPQLQQLATSGFCAPLTPVCPAVTTSAQVSMLTGTLPEQHGIVANGWYFRDLAEVWLWRQSQSLVQKPHVWASIRQQRPLKVLKHFWWYAMNTDADATVTPRPVYHADGAKSPDFYAWPRTLKQTISKRHGTFPLFNFWGPTASITSTDWIADAFCTAWQQQQPDLGLCYLPHLDYDLQRFGPTGPHLASNLNQVDHAFARIYRYAQKIGAEMLVVSEYGIESVNHAIPINTRLREAGCLEVVNNAAGELLDPGVSKAFAVADHQIAHIYCQDSAAIKRAQAVVADIPEIECCLAGNDRSELGLNHERSGELVLLAKSGSWFTYDYWLDQRYRPDFANHVDIHKKPGYDPRELFFDPRGGKKRAAMALLKKKLRLRYRMNPVPLDTSLVKGSHGRLPSSPNQGPLIIGSQKQWNRPHWHQTMVADCIAEHFLSV